MAAGAPVTVTPFIDKTSERKNLAPWERPWWRTTTRQAGIFGWIILIHVTALVGLIMFPLPGWPIFLGALALAWIGGIGTTVCYHRAIAHRALKLNPIVRQILTFFAVFNGSGAPVSWTANHRLHHASADSDDDISSPRHGFWWAHLRWLWQTPKSSAARFCPDLSGFSYHAWTIVQTPILALSFFIGLHFGWAAFFWLGAIRLVFALHGQCFVNSICHTEPGVREGQDSSRNVGWLAAMQLVLGENWHRNHHSRPGLARLGWNWHQPDAGYLVIRGLEKLGLASEVRDFRQLRSLSSES
ncbi:MAG TPA: fatty acid desaturase [Candidatus Binataceae bacterium]|nr:fatty acid desaturase [Candidatus Binataceae bacterium]